jgi:uncharacterized protein DUF6335
MAKRRAGKRARRAKAAPKGKKRAAKSRPARSVRAKRAAPKRAAKAKRAAAPKRAARPKAAVKAAEPKKVPRLERQRRTLDDIVPTPPSSLDMDRRSSAARSGRAELAETRHEQRNMSPEIAGGDVDVDLEDAYFTGEEVPGGDNPTPDMDIVDDIGKALGVEYNDDEELKGGDKVGNRDKHRWELDPASSEDYKDRK